MRTFVKALLALCSVCIVATPALATADNDDRSSPAVYGKTAPAKVMKGKKASGSSSYAYAPAYSSSSVVAQARRYIGTNPTGRSSLWCGAFMDLVLKQTGHRGGGNLAKGYLGYGSRVSGPQVGALAIFSRGKVGGHVGVVSGVDDAGNPIIVSGNHNNTVAESVYPKHRVLAYVMP